MSRSLTRTLLSLAVPIVLVAAALAATSSASADAPAPPSPAACDTCWHPAVNTSWNWVLSTVPKAPFRNVQMYDIDGFNATASDVTSLHDNGIKAVCYISAGTYENWRSDASQFPASLLGAAPRPRSVPCSSWFEAVVTGGAGVQNEHGPERSLSSLRP